ncbi:MAG: diphthine--ammonia ligase [Candidatus Aenigmatarchaeota archaeon]
MKLAALVSGGKDSLYALWKEKKQNEIDYLICVKPKPDSKFLHAENLEVVKLQSESMGIPLIWREGSGEGVKPLEDAVEAVSGEVDGVVSGALASNYQKERVKKICEKFSLESLTPLWHGDEEELMEGVLQEGFEVVVTKVAAQGLGKEWLGRKLDQEAMKELKELKEKYGIHMSGEGGELETLVVDCPLFQKKITLEKIRKGWDGRTKTGYLEVLEASL